MRGSDRRAGGAWPAARPLNAAPARRAGGAVASFALALGCAVAFAAAVGAAPLPPLASAASRSRPAPATAAAPPWRYTVVAGDTLIGIARAWLQHPDQWRELQRSNRIADPRRLPVGRVLAIPAALLGAQATVATVVATRGEVRRARAGGAETAAEPGQTLEADDSLRTGDDAVALLELGDGTRVQLAAGTRLTLRELRVVRATSASDASLELHEGRTDTRVPEQAPTPRFEIRTPVMTLGVRGTRFRAEVDPAAALSRAEVVQGRVWVGGVGAPDAPLAAGFGVVARAGRIEPPRALLGAPDLSALPARVERLPLALAWRADPRALGWRVQVLDAADPSRVWRDGRFADARASWGGDLPDGRYRLRVRPIDEQGLEGEDAERPFELDARPEPPPTLEPRAGGRSHGPTARWRWAAPGDGVRVRLQVAPREDFAAPAIDAEGLTGDTLERPLAPGRWWWRVASMHPADGPGPWSDALAFEQRELPPAPSAELSARDDGVRVLQWSRRDAGDRYRVQLAAAADAGFAAPLIDRELGAPMLAIDPAPAPGRYRVRLRTLDADGVAGPWGAPSELEVPQPWWWWLAPAALLLLVL